MTDSTGGSGEREGGGATQVMKDPQVHPTHLHLCGGWVRFPPTPEMERQQYEWIAAKCVYDMNVNSVHGKKASNRF